MRAIRELAAATPLLFFFAAFVLGCAGCVGFMPSAEHEIRESIERMRQAKLARDADAVVGATTPDWRFESGGRFLAREAYRTWLSEQLAKCPVESIAVEVSRIDVRGRLAEVSLRQTIVRSEPDASGRFARWRVVSVENQEWVKTARGWRFAQAQQWPQERTRLQN